MDIRCGAPGQNIRKQRLISHRMDPAKIDALMQFCTFDFLEVRMIDYNDVELIEEQLRKLFRMNLKADIRAIKMTLQCNGQAVTPQLQERIDRVTILQAGMEALYCVLSENEKIVIQRHYVAGLDWDCVGSEFAQKWGMEAQKSKRSLINYLNKAFRKMAQYVQSNATDFTFDWLFEL